MWCYDAIETTRYGSVVVQTKYTKHHYDTVILYNIYFFGSILYRNKCLAKLMDSFVIGFFFMQYWINICILNWWKINVCFVTISDINKQVLKDSKTFPYMIKKAGEKLLNVSVCTDRLVCFSITVHYRSTIFVFSSHKSQSISVITWPSPITRLSPSFDMLS